MDRSLGTTGEVWLVGGARTEEARLRGRRRFVFALSENPSDAWKSMFELACKRAAGHRWGPAEIWNGELAIEILLDDRDHVQAYLADRFREASDWVSRGGVPR
ncbi:MAG: hypothetical protein ABIT01_04405 [Thermoanaerobaculia bacterium]